MYVRKRGRLSSSRSGAPPPTGRRRAVRQLAYFGQGVGVQRVVHPAALPTIGDQARVLQHLQVKRQPGLRGIERIGEIADAALAHPEALEDREPGAVGQGVEQPDGPLGVEVACEWTWRHTVNISRFTDVSTWSHRRACGVRGESASRMTAAEAGQASRNSTDARTASGTCVRLDRREAEPRKPALGRRGQEVDLPQPRRRERGRAPRGPARRRCRCPGRRGGRPPTGGARRTHSARGRSHPRGRPPCRPRGNRPSVRGTPAVGRPAASSKAITAW